MNIPKSEKKKLDLTLSTFLAEKGIKLTVPVDAFALSTAAGFDNRWLFRDREMRRDGCVLPQHLEDGWAAIYVEESRPRALSFRTNKVIAIDSRVPILQAKYYIAHLLSHYIIEKERHGNTPIDFAVKETVLPDVRNSDEAHLNYMASTILVPTDSIQKKLQGLDLYQSIRLAPELADWYKVEYWVIIQRIMDMFQPEY